MEVSDLVGTNTILEIFEFKQKRWSDVELWINDKFLSWIEEWVLSMSMRIGLFIGSNKRKKIWIFGAESETGGWT